MVTESRRSIRVQIEFVWMLRCLDLLSCKIKYNNWDDKLHQSQLHDQHRDNWTRRIRDIVCAQQMSTLDTESPVLQSPFKIEKVSFISYKYKLGSYLPYKVFAMATKRWLLEKPGQEFVIFNVDALFLAQSSSSSKLLLLFVRTVLIQNRSCTTIHDWVNQIL